MKKIYVIILTLIILIACKKSKVDIDAEKNIQDSLSYYLKRSDLINISENKKLFFLNNAFRLISTSPNNIKNRDSLFSIAFKYYNIKEWEMFDKASLTLLKNSLSSNDSINLAKAYRYRAGYYKNTRVYDSSFYYYLKAEKIYLKNNNKIDYATILENKGIVQFCTNNFLGADLSLRSAYNIFKSTNEKFKLYETLNQLGLNSNILKEYDKSLVYHNEALKVVREFNLDNENHNEATCLNNIGYLYLKQKQYSNAIFYFKEALKNKKIITEAPDLYAYLVDNLAYSKLESRTYNDLPELFFEALKIRKTLGDSSPIIASYIHLSEYYQTIGSIELSEQYSKTALKIAKKSKIPIDIIAALKQASYVDKVNSSKYSEDYIRISDSLQVVERNSKDRFARIELETDELKKENIDLEEKNRNILNYFMGTMLFVGVLFFMRAQRARRRELILTQAQQRANEEIYKLIITQQNKLDEGRVMEKSRIAKELHDGVLGRMFGLRLNLDGLNKRDDEPAIQERLRCLEELKIIEQDLREISHELSREKYVLINNFVAIVNSLLEDQSKVNTAVLNYKIGVDIDWDLLSNTTKINLYRILQETLQNINKYAKAKNIKVEFKKDKKGNLILNIADDGIGFDVAKKSKGIGLKNIVTRTHESEGTIEIKSFVDKGSQIKITVPLDSKSIKI